MNKRVDMAGLARLAGVSKSTVSRALADSPLVSKATKQVIIDLAAESGYAVNTTARNFRLGRTGIVAVVLTLEPNSPQTTNDPFFMTMIAEIAEQLRDRGYNTLLSHERLTTSQSFLQSQTCQGSDGVIFIGQGRHHDTLNELASAGLPMAVWGAELSGRVYPLVGSDNELGGYLACRHLLSRGCKRIGFMGDLDYPEPQLRYSGYVRALKEAGYADSGQAVEASVSFDPTSARRAMRDYLANNKHIDGLLCCSDVIAISAISLLQELGRRVPEDVSVVGYDNLSLAEITHPTLTSIDQDVPWGAKQLCDSLFSQVNELECSDRLASARLVIRASA